jgi:hypothetical protein
VQLEWLDYRLSPEAAGVQRQVVIDDFRQAEHPLPVLEQWLAEIGPPPKGEEVPIPILIWAEGEAKARLAERFPGAVVVGREALASCAALAIWTTPPSAADLASALERTKPQRLALFSVDPEMDQPQAFLERLTGVARYAIAHAGGSVSLLRLAAATAQREAVVRKALEWMAARGILAVEFADGEVHLAAGQIELADPRAAASRLEQLTHMLAETRAFRNYYSMTENTKLLVNR